MRLCRRIFLYWDVLQSKRNNLRGTIQEEESSTLAIACGTLSVSDVVGECGNGRSYKDSAAIEDVRASLVQRVQQRIHQLDKMSRACGAYVIIGLQSTGWKLVRIRDTG